MANKYYDPQTGKVDFKAIEKAVGYKLDPWEKEYAEFYYQEGSCYGKDLDAVPDFCSETASDFHLMYYSM